MRKWWRNRRTHKVRILYKNGVVMTFRCNEFNVRRDSFDDTLKSVEWGNARPRPMHMGVNEITAIWQVR